MKLLIEIDGETYNIYKHYGNIVHSMTIGTAIKNGIPVSDNAFIGEWISVKDRLPEDEVTVMASCGQCVLSEARYSKKNGWEWAYESGSDYWEELYDVSAWMPLPEPYKEGE